MPRSAVQRKATSAARGPPADRGGGPGSSTANGARGGARYSLDDGSVHYGSGPRAAAAAGGSPSGGGIRGKAEPGHWHGFSATGGDGSGGSGDEGAASGGGGGHRGCPSANAAHSAALEEKVQRRLRQNREAAQRSRKRKKAYMAQLEAEVRSLQVILY